MNLFAVYTPLRIIDIFLCQHTPLRKKSALTIRYTPPISTPNTTISSYFNNVHNNVKNAYVRAAIQPYGRLSSRGEKERGATCDFHVFMLILVFAICLVLVLLEILYLLEYTA